jgi:hypothetical protein
VNVSAIETEKLVLVSGIALIQARSDEWVMCREFGQSKLSLM